MTVKSAKEVDGLKIVNLDWLIESIKNGKRGDEGGFLVGDGGTVAGSSAVAAPAVAKAAVAAPIVTKAEPEELPKKRTRGKAAAPPAAKVAADEESEEETKPAAKKAKAMPVGKGKGKGKAKEEPGEDEGEEEVKKIKTVVKKGKAPVDELCPIAGMSLFKDINVHKILISSRESPCLRRPRWLSLRRNPKPS